ncbi:hypothetical protein GCM10027047_31990 [Rhodococcus aerolatus]
MSVVAVVVAVLLLSAAALTVVRLVRGPTSLDRVVATDTLVAVAMCGVAAHTAFTGDSTVLAGVAALTLLGFLGSISVARFRARGEQR